MILNVRVKDPDLIYEYVRKAARSEKERQKLYDEFFEFGDYGMLELDTKTEKWRWLPLDDWA